MLFTEMCSLAESNGKFCGMRFSKELHEFSHGELKICRYHLEQLHGKDRASLACIRLYETDTPLSGSHIALLDAYFKYGKHPLKIDNSNDDSVDDRQIKDLQDEIDKLQTILNRPTPSYRMATLEEQNEFTRKIMEDSDEKTDFSKMLEDYMDSLTV